MEKLRLIKCWKALLLLIGFSMYSMALMAQTHMINGTVLDEKDSPLVGVTIKLKDSQTATTTNTDGKFSIEVPSAAGFLVVSYIGYTTQEIPIGKATGTLKINLTAGANSLNEVVVVGYGTQRKRDVTGAVGTINAAALAEVPSANVVDQLKGRMAGVDIQSNSTQPGASGQIRIRGEHSLGVTQGQADNQNSPLIIVDGIPFIGGSINDINQNDIASLDILKDASATAIYGSRGSSGVILITTKRGKSGRAQMSYNSYFGISNRLGDYKLFDGQEYAAFKQSAAELNTVSPGTTAYGLTTAEQAGLTAGTNTNWQDIIFRRGFTTDNELSLSGGDENTQYSLSGGYHKDQGIVYGQSFERYSLRSTIDHQINKRLKVGLNSLESVGYTNGADRFPVGGALRFSPLVSPYNADGSINLLPLVGSLDAPIDNPITIRDKTTNSDLSRRLSTFNSLYGEVKILEGLKYRANIGLTYDSQSGGMYSGPNTFYNNATSYSQASESVNNSENWSYTLENLLTYERIIAQKHHLTVTGLYSVEKDHSQSSAFNGVGIPADYLQYYNLGQAGSVSAGPAGFSERGLQSYMGRVNYVYNGKYSLTATLREDGSSVFPNKKYFTYPAVAAAWNLDQEDFIRSINVISALKLRAGYGKTSSQSVAPYSSLGLLSSNFYNFGPVAIGGANGYYVSTLANQNLTWEFTNSFNIGLDFGLFNNRLTGSVDAYSERTNNILQQVNLPYTNGASTVLENTGKTKGEGLEISLSSVNFRSTSGFNWSTDFNISFNRDAIVSLHDGLTQDIGNNWFVGQPFNVIYDLKKIGIWQTNEAAQAATFGQVPGQIKVEDTNHDGKITAADLQIIGNFQPKFISGLTNRFSYKNVDLSFVIFARIGQMVGVPYLASDGSAQGYPFFMQGRVNQWKVDYWTPGNPTNAFPKPDASVDHTTYASTLQYRDGSFIRMRSINMGYTFSPGFLKGSGISSLRIFASCTNPFIIWSPLVKSGLGIDPEGNGYGGLVSSTVNSAYPTAGGGNAGTTSSRAITTNLNDPSTRNFQLGVNVKF